MPRKSKTDLLIQQAQRLFVQRLYIATHLILFVLALVLSRGRVARLGILFAVWVALLLLHAVYYALYENREAVLRRNYQSMDDNEYVSTENDEVVQPDVDNEKQKDGYYTVGTDGELIPLDEDGEVKRDAK